MIKLAIVVPYYNEEEVLTETAKRLGSEMTKLVNNKMSQESYVLFVNYGSVDKTWNMIKELHESNNVFCGQKEKWLINTPKVTKLFKDEKNKS